MKKVDKHTYRITHSEAAQCYVGTCQEYPCISADGLTPQDALTRIIRAIRAKEMDAKEVFRDKLYNVVADFYLGTQAAEHNHKVKYIEENPGIPTVTIKVPAFINMTPVFDLAVNKCVDRLIELINYNGEVK
jgi:hypothetical protein